MGYLYFQMNATTLPPLADRGTAGLLAFVASGTDRLYSARLARALKIFSARRKCRDARWLFVEVASDERCERNGWAKPILSPLKRLAAVKAGDPTSHYVR